MALTHGWALTWEDADDERTRLKDLQRKGIPVDTTTSNDAVASAERDSDVAAPSVYLLNGFVDHIDGALFALSGTRE